MMNNCTTVLPSLPKEIINNILLTAARFVNYKTRKRYFNSLKAKTDQKMGLFGRNLILEGLNEEDFFGWTYLRQKRINENNMYTFCGGEAKFHRFPLIILSSDLYYKLLDQESSMNPFEEISEEVWKTISTWERSKITTQAVIRGIVKGQDSPFILMNLCHDGKSDPLKRIFYSYIECDNRWRISGHLFKNYYTDDHLMGYNLENALKKEPKSWPREIHFANALKQLLTKGSCDIDPRDPSQGKIRLLAENKDPLK